MPLRVLILGVNGFIGSSLTRAILTAPKFQGHAANAKRVAVPAERYFGKDYQDIERRLLSIVNARKRLGWMPKVNLQRAIKLTLDYHLAHRDYQLE